MRESESKKMLNRLEGTSMSVRKRKRNLESERFAENCAALRVNAKFSD
jgi:hypothetical protein